MPKKTERKIHHLGAKLPMALWRKLARHKRKTGLPVSYMVRVALAEYIERYEAEARK